MKPLLLPQFSPHFVVVVVVVVVVLVLLALERSIV